MFLAKTKSIDGITVIIGISEAQVDAVLTERAIKEDYGKSLEYQALKTRLKKMHSYRIMINSLDNSAVRLFMRVAKRINKIIQDVKPEDLTSAESEKITEYATLKIKNKDSIMTIEKELKGVSENLGKKRIELLNKHAIYFEPGKDVEITDKQVVEFRDKLRILGKKQFLTLDGNIIDDNRGRIAYFKNAENRWIIQNVFMLGEKIDTLSIWSEDLTDEQRQEIGVQIDTERIAGLDATEKVTEFETLKDGIALQAALMRSKLEIQEDPEALVKSQEWYKAEIIKLEDKYK